MVKIIDKIKKIEDEKPNSPYFSFEYFPPKTEAGVENLYLRMERMTSLHPLFVDVTWGAGGITKRLTMGICEYSQKYFGTEVMMHLTCAGLPKEKLVEILQEAKDAGITNILALRGDPPKGAAAWKKHPSGVERAVDLVRLIKSEFGDYFGIAVAGFPEGHPNSRESPEMEIIHLKDKIAAGADFVLTQFFYDTQMFVKYLARCRAAHITCPIIPGMMPIQSYSSFQRMTSFCRTTVPNKVWEDLKPIRENDEAVKSYGVELARKMCTEMMDAGIQGFHFYT
jgi:methylenetetrahydrofolate reductase (NADPH)